MDLVERNELTEALIKSEACTENFKEIYELNIRCCKLKGIKNLDKLIKLRSLDLSCNYIEKVEHLEALTSLRDLKLYCNLLRKIEGLDKNRELQSLTIHSNNITEISNLNYLSNLQTLRLDDNQISKIENLVHNRSLTSLNLNHNQIAKIERLLQELFLETNQISTVENLDACKGTLLELHLSENPLQNLGGLNKFAKLQVLKLEKCNLSSIESIPKIPTLTELFLGHNSITSVARVGSLFPQLELLHVSDNKITDIDDVLAGLENSSELVELFLRGNPCTNVANYRALVAARIPILQLLDGIELVATAPDSSLPNDDEGGEVDNNPVSRPSSASGLRPGTPHFNPGSQPPMRPMTARQMSLISFGEMEAMLQKMKTDLIKEKMEVSQGVQQLRTAMKNYDDAISFAKKRPASAKSPVTTGTPEMRSPTISESTKEHQRSESLDMINLAVTQNQEEEDYLDSQPSDRIPNTKSINTNNNKNSPKKRQSNRTKTNSRTMESQSSPQQRSKKAVVPPLPASSQSLPSPLSQGNGSPPPSTLYPTPTSKGNTLTSIVQSPKKITTEADGNSNVPPVLSLRSNSRAGLLEPIELSKDNTLDNNHDLEEEKENLTHSLNDTSSFDPVESILRKNNSNSNNPLKIPGSLIPLNTNQRQLQHQYTKFKVKTLGSQPVIGSNPLLSSPTLSPLKPLVVPSIPTNSNPEHAKDSPDHQ